jgi:hypothetical protein
MTARHLLLLPIVTTWVAGATLVEAQWSPDPNVNNAVAVVTDMQSVPVAISDGSNGAIFAWLSARFDPGTSTTVYDIYAQRIGDSGVPLWALNGVPVVLGTVSAEGAPLVRPFSLVAYPFPGSGVIVTWRDIRNSPDGDIYAQRLSSTGIPQWVVGGMPVSTATGVQQHPLLVSDLSGGAIIVWEDGRAGPGNSDIYAQRLSGSGLPLWIPTGLPVCNAPGDQALPAIVPILNGGANIAWVDSRGANQDIYAQQLSLDGGRQWTLNGVAVSVAPGNQTRPAIDVLGSYGASIAWEDYRNGGDSDIYAQAVNDLGVPQWTSNGLQVASTPNATAPAIAVDFGGGSTYIVWQDERNGAANVDIFAQRISFSGTPQWQANGVTVSAAPGNQISPAVVPSDSGSAVVAWEDARNGPSDVFAQRIAPSGAALWTPDGVPVSTAANGQRRVRLQLSPFSVQTIMVWEDDRNAATGTDIYASRVSQDGTLPVTLERFSVE